MALLIPVVGPSQAPGDLSPLMRLISFMFVLALYYSFGRYRLLPTVLFGLYRNLPKVVKGAIKRVV